MNASRKAPAQGAVKRVCHVADSHWNTSKRFSECARLHGLIAEHIERTKPDLIVHSGEVFDRPSNPREREAAAEWIQRVADVCPIAIVRGNPFHESEFDIEHLKRLRARYPIVATETPQVIMLAGVYLALLPAPTKAGVLSACAELGLPAANQTTQEALQAILRYFGQALDDGVADAPRLLVMHGMVSGAIASTGQDLTGRDIDLSLLDLSLARCGGIAAGHVHKHQLIDGIPGMPVVYAGSSYRTSFAETEAKGFVEWTFEGTRASWRFVELPATPMVLLDAEWTEGGWIGKPATTLPLVSGAEVRWRYTVSSDLRKDGAEAAECMKARLLDMGAVDVQLEPMIRVTSKARAPEIASAKGIEQKLPAFWRARNTTPEEPRASRLVGYAKELEAKHRPQGGVAAGAALVDWIKLRGIGPFREAAEVDFRTMPPGIVAITGRVGSGKTSLIESYAAACYRKLPTEERGLLAKMATARDSYVDVGLQNGQSLRILHEIDAVSGGWEAAVYDQDDPNRSLTGSTKVTAFDKWRDGAMLPKEIFLSGPFMAQGHNELVTATDGERKAILLRGRGLEHYEAMAEEARKRAAGASSAVEVAEARLGTERERAGDVAETAARLEECRAALQLAEMDVPGLTEQVDAARAELERVRVAAEGWKTKSAEGERLAASVTAQQQRLDELTGRLTRACDTATAARRAIVETEPTIPGLEAEVERCRRWGAETAEYQRNHRAQQQKARDLRSQADPLAAKCKDLHDRVENNEKVLGRAEEIRAAVAAKEAALTRSRGLERQALETSAQQREKLADAMAAGQRSRDADAGAKAARGRIAVLLADLDREAEIRAAVAALPELRVKADRLRGELDAAELEVERLRGQRMAGAEDRIEQLRDGHERVVKSQTIGSASPFAISASALQWDDQAVQTARELPAATRAAADKVTSLRSSLAVFQGDVLKAEKVAERAESLAHSREAIEAAEQEERGHLARAQEHRLLAEELGSESRALAEEVERLSKESSEQADAAKKLDPIVPLAKPLESAETRLAELRPQLEETRAQWKALCDEIDDVESWLAANGELDETEPAEAVRQAERVLAAATRTLADSREKVAASEATAAALGPQIDAAQDQLIGDSLGLAHLREWLALNPCPTVDAYAEALQGAELGLAAARKAATDATSTLAVAESKHATALEAADRIAALASELTETRERQADWTRLAEDLGKKGLQGAEVDLIGPILTECTNDLLRSCLSSQYTVRVETTRLGGDGQELEACPIIVTNSADGYEGDVRTYSGGQKALIGEALALAHTIMVCDSAAGDHEITAFRDEPTSALSPEDARAYVAMLRRASEIVHARHIVCVTHNESVAEAADVRLEVADGKVRIAA